MTLPTEADRETARAVLRKTHGASWDDDVAENVAKALAAQRAEQPRYTGSRGELADQVELACSRFELYGGDIVSDLRAILNGPQPPAYTLTQTCPACPTQYDVELEDGRYAYFRYRHGAVSLELYTSEDAMGGEPLAAWGEQRGDALDGVMDHATVVAVIAEHLPRLAREADRG